MSFLITGALKRCAVAQGLPLVREMSTTSQLSKMRLNDGSMVPATVVHKVWCSVSYVAKTKFEALYHLANVCKNVPGAWSKTPKKYQHLLIEQNLIDYRGEQLEPDIKKVVLNCIRNPGPLGMIVDPCGSSTKSTKAK